MAAAAPLSLLGRAKAALLPPDRNHGVDLLRGLSLLLVVTSHYGLIGWLTGKHAELVGGRTVDEIGNGLGYYGVTLFFVISGYLITSISLRRYEALPRISLHGFWWFRFARIMPNLGLCLAALLLLHFLRVGDFVFGDATLLGRSVAALLSFRFNEVIGATGVPPVWNPLWSLSVEEMFYLAFPLVARLLTGPGAVAWVVTAAGATSFYLRITEGSPFGTWACAHLLVLGCLLALLPFDRLRDRLAGLAPVTAAGLALIGLGLVAGVAIVWHPFAAAWCPLACGLGGAALLAASRLAELPSALRRLSAPLALLGVVSYEAYLLHLPGAHLLTRAGVTSLGMQLVILAAAATLLHLLYAEPLNRWLRRKLW